VATLIILQIINFMGLFLLWTLIVYGLHRLSHIKHKFNFLYFIHIHHHRVNYSNASERKFNWRYLLFFFGSFYESLDVLITMTLPALVLYFIFPAYGAYILVFHYLYEVFLSENQLDHNPNISGVITNYFSWGKYHLKHHKDVRCNYSLIIPLWDFVFGTQKNGKQEQKLLNG
jgi:sterol desaturase/sphingolipid hydroxylase (fatty acid hydroxylase superfamily)